MTWKNLGTALICIFHCAPCVPDSRPLYLQLSWFLPLLVISTETTLTKANCYSDLPYPTNSFSCNMIIIIVEIYLALDILDVFDTFDADSPKNSQLPWLSGHHSLLVSPLSLALSFLASSKCLFFPSTSLYRSWGYSMFHVQPILFSLVILSILIVLDFTYRLTAPTYLSSTLTSLPPTPTHRCLRGISTSVWTVLIIIYPTLSQLSFRVSHRNPNPPPRILPLPINH